MIRPIHLHPCIQPSTSVAVDPARHTYPHPQACPSPFFERFQSAGTKPISVGTSGFWQNTDTRIHALMARHFRKGHSLRPDYSLSIDIDASDPAGRLLRPARAWQALIRPMDSSSVLLCVAAEGGRGGSWRCWEAGVFQNPGFLPLGGQWNFLPSDSSLPPQQRWFLPQHCT